MESEEPPKKKTKLNSNGIRHAISTLLRRTTKRKQFAKTLYHPILGKRQIGLYPYLMSGELSVTCGQMRNALRDWRSQTQFCYITGTLVLSNALSLYERPTTSQKQCVSYVLVQGNKSFSESETLKQPPRAFSTPQPLSALGTGGSALFFQFDTVELYITISPQNLVMNVGNSIVRGPTPTEQSKDFSYLFQGVSMDEFETDR